MLTIRNLELSRTFIGGDYRKTKYVTKAEVSIGARYNKADVTLTDEQTAKAVSFILEMIRESMSVEMEVPELIEDEAVALPSPIAAGEDELAPL